MSTKILLVLWGVVKGLLKGDVNNAICPDSVELTPSVLRASCALVKVLESLMLNIHEVKIDQEILEKARLPIEKMLQFSK